MCQSSYFILAVTCLLHAVQISVAKGGLTAILPARTTILAAANPAGGRYCHAKTLQENVKMRPALFSRFDLVFRMLDTADEDADAKLSEHVMGVHCRGARLPSCTLLCM